VTSWRRPRLSLVVLPFENLSGDKEQDYFTDGITDDLTGEGVATDQLIRRPDPDWAIEDRFLC
jgi:hypothetical protein